MPSVHIPKTIRYAALIIATLAGTAALAVPAAADVAQSTPSIVGTFEGKEIRLATGWGDATACTTNGDSARCYRSEAEMDAAERNVSINHPTRNTLLSECSLPSLRLYSGTGHSGSVLQITTRNTTINLALHGFNNLTSSYRVGACSARFYDTTTGGTSYPGNTSAHVSATSMMSGWNNRVGSVYLL